MRSLERERPGQDFGWFGGVRPLAKTRTYWERVATVINRWFTPPI